MSFIVVNQRIYNITVVNDYDLCCKLRVTEIAINSKRIWRTTPVPFSTCHISSFVNWPCYLCHAYIFTPVQITRGEEWIKAGVCFCLEYWIGNQLNDYENAAHIDKCFYITYPLTFKINPNVSLIAINMSYTFYSF